MCLLSSVWENEKERRIVNNEKERKKKVHRMKTIAWKLMKCYPNTRIILPSIPDKFP